jgi:hypothetical protein
LQKSIDADSSRAARDSLICPPQSTKWEVSRISTEQIPRMSCSCQSTALAVKLAVKNLTRDRPELDVLGAGAMHDHEAEADIRDQTPCAPMGGISLLAGA